MILLILLSIASPVQDAPLSPADRDDLRCVAAFSVVLSAVSEEQKAGVTAGVMYFIGRLDGRSSGFDLQANLPRAAADMDDQAKLTTEIQRCAGILASKGQELIAIGQQMQNSGN